MTLRGAPLRYVAAGVADTIDATDIFPGAMSALTNLVPLPSTQSYWICRPAAEELTDFDALPDPGLISCMLVVGDLLVGMIASSTFAGRDEPFVYDLDGGMFVAITGATGVNTPTSPATSGAWQPPTMDIIGTKVIITHPGFDGTGTNFFGVIDLNNPGAPTYASSNTSGTALPRPPIAVKNFNQRAYYAVNPSTGNPGTYFTDILDPIAIGAPTDVLTYDDNIPLTALGALPLTNQLGGVIQALIVFKGVTNLYQVTGDADTPGGSTLARNSLNIATGTLAPLSITPTPYGLMFLSPDGYRLINFQAQVSDPIGAQGAGIVVPFQYANVPSRVVAACNADVLRVSTQNANEVDSPYQEYWYHFSRKIWSGPHTLPAAQIQRWRNTFVMAPVDHLHSLARSDTIPSLTTTFEEYGEQLDWEYTTAYLPDPSQMAQMAMIETTVNIARSTAAGNIQAFAIDQDGAIIDQVTFPVPGAPTVWGAFVWGASPWLGALVGLRVKQIAWTIPIVFRRLQLSLVGSSASGVILGDFFMRYDILGYLTEDFDT